MTIVTLARLFRRIRARRGIAASVVLSLLLVSLLGNAITFYVFDGAEGDVSFVDALWYSIISVTTIGYGDYSASSIGARLGTIVFIVIVGLGAFTVALGMAIDWVTEFTEKGRRGMSRILTENHILIVNFPSENRVLQMIDELQSDPEHKEQDIVIVTDQLDRMSFTRDKVMFVKGSPHDQDTYDRARVSQARLAIVLARSYSDLNSDAIAASAVAVIGGMNEKIHIVAECLNAKHKMLFDSVRCDAVVYSMQICGNLLAQEIHDPGISQLVDVITSNTRGTTLFSTQVGRLDGDFTYNAFAKSLLDRNVNLLCVNRNEDSYTAFIEIHPEPGDRVIYAASQRYSWNDLVAMMT